MSVDNCINLDLVYGFVNDKVNDHLFGKELFLVFRNRLSVCRCPSFPFGFGDRKWDLILLISDRHFLFATVPYLCI